jgi:hypothetical protein
MMSVSKEFQILIPPTRQHLDKKIFDLLLLLSPGEGSDSTSQGNTTDLVALNDRGTHKLRRKEIDQAVIHRPRRQRTDLQALTRITRITLYNYNNFSTSDGVHQA